MKASAYEREITSVKQAAINPPDSLSAIQQQLIAEKMQLAEPPDDDDVSAEHDKKTFTMPLLLAVGIISVGFVVTGFLQITGADPKEYVRSADNSFTTYAQPAAVSQEKRRYRAPDQQKTESRGKAVNGLQFDNRSIGTSSTSQNKTRAGGQQALKSSQPNFSLAREFDKRTSVQPPRPTEYAAGLARPRISSARISTLAAIENSARHDTPSSLTVDFNYHGFVSNASLVRMQLVDLSSKTTVVDKSIIVTGQDGRKRNVIGLSKGQLPMNRFQLTFLFDNEVIAYFELQPF